MTTEIGWCPVAERDAAHGYPSREEILADRLDAGHHALHEEPAQLRRDLPVLDVDACLAVRLLEPQLGEREREVDVPQGDLDGVPQGCRADQRQAPGAVGGDVVVPAGDDAEPRFVAAVTQEVPHDLELLPRGRLGARVVEHLGGQPAVGQHLVEGHAALGRQARHQVDAGRAAWEIPVQHESSRRPHCSPVCPKISIGAPIRRRRAEQKSDAVHSGAQV